MAGIDMSDIKTYEEKMYVVQDKTICPHIMNEKSN